MGIVILLLGYVAPVFGLLAAIHLNRHLRSPETLVLLVSSVVVVGAAIVQIAGMMLGLVMIPEPGSFGMRLLGYIGGYTAWPWTIGNFVYLLTIFLIFRKLPLGGNKSIDGKSLNGVSRA